MNERQLTLLHANYQFFLLGHLLIMLIKIAKQLAKHLMKFSIR